MWSAWKFHSFLTHLSRSRTLRRRRLERQAMRPTNRQWWSTEYWFFSIWDGRKCIQCFLLSTEVPCNNSKMYHFRRPYCNSSIAHLRYHVSTEDPDEVRSEPIPWLHVDQIRVGETATCLPKLSIIMTKFERKIKSERLQFLMFHCYFRLSLVPRVSIACRNPDEINTQHWLLTFRQIWLLSSSLADRSEQSEIRLHRMREGRRWSKRSLRISLKFISFCRSI